MNPDTISSALEQALTYHRRGESLQAIDRLHALLSQRPSGTAWYTLANIYHDLHRHKEAIASYQQAINASPNLPEAYNNLALALEETGEIGQAVDVLRTALKLSPKYFNGHLNMARLLRRIREYEAAISHCENALAIDPHHIAPLVELGRIHFESRRTRTGIRWLQLALEKQPDMHQVNRLLGKYLLRDGQPELAYAYLRKVILSGISQIGLFFEMANACLHSGRTREARDWYARILAQEPASLEAIVNEALSLPMVYVSTSHLTQERARYRQQLRRLISHVSDYAKHPLQVRLTTAQRTNFHLAYQGKNDLDLQVEYGKFIHSLLSNCIPPHRSESAAERKGKIRIGFASRFFRTCTVGNYFKAWITRLDKSQFFVASYSLATEPDAVTAEVESASDIFRTLIGSLTDAASIIKQDQLDVLVYPELGMDGFTFALATQRLAPIQCCGWGHPVTSGLTTIDYYITCDEMEPPDATAHYSEQLVRLPGIGTHYQRPIRPPAATRREAGLPEGRFLFLVPQSLFKLHPDNDDMFIHVLERNEDAMIVAFEDHYPVNTAVFLSRFGSKLHSAGMVLEDRLVLLGTRPHESFLQINALCDAMLDSLYWSGGNTTLDALSCGLPVVTLPGEFMRGRQSMAILKQIGLDELVASDIDDYISIATRLVNDVAFRIRLRESILRRIDSVFGQSQGIKTLQMFLASLAPSLNNDTDSARR